MTKALVFGATGQLGRAVGTTALNAGWKVIAVTRNRPEQLPEGVEALVAGNQTRSQIIGKLGFSIDAVFDPTAYDEADALDLLSASTYFGSAVVVSSCSVYADAQGRSLDEAAQNGFPQFDAPMTEATPTIPPGPQTYSTRKVTMENVFRASPLPITILRPCAIYGKHATHPREWWLIKRALDGRRQIPIAYSGESIFHTSSAAGIASLAELCMRNPAQRILNVADPQALTIREIAMALESATQLPIALHPFAGNPICSVGASPWSVPRPYVLNCGAAKALGWDGGQVYGEAVKKTAQWLLQFKAGTDWQAQLTGFSNYADGPFDYAAEDQFLQES
jgi:nucleoside-diphosphate-sugar epimerase